MPMGYWECERRKRQTEMSRSTLLQEKFSKRIFTMSPLRGFAGIYLHCFYNYAAPSELFGKPANRPGCQLTDMTA